MKYLNKTIEYGLYLLVFTLSIQTRWIIKAGGLNGGYSEYLTFSLYGTDVLLILLLLMFVVRAAYSWIAGQARNDKVELASRNGSFMYWFIGGLLAVGAVSGIFAVDQALAFYKLGWLVLGAGLFWLIVKANYNRLKLLYGVLAGIFFQAALGIWQFLSQSSFANKWLGLASHNAADLGTSVIEAIGADGLGERWLRAYGGLDHPNIFGGMLAIGILLVIGQIIMMERENNFQFSLVEPGQAIFNFQTIFNDKIFKIINWLLLPVFTAALFFSFSRAGWLALAVALAVMMIIAVAGRNLKSQKSLAEIILIMGLAWFLLFSQYQNLIASRLGGEGRLEEKSTSERLTSYQESWLMIKNNWITGVGLGNYTLALSRQTPGKNSFYYQPAHNVFMLVWSEVGIVGLLFFAGLLFAIARSSDALAGATRQSLVELRIREIAKFIPSEERDPRFPSVARNDKKEYRDSRNGIIILIALIVIMSFDHWLWSLHFGVLFFWLVLGLAASRERDEIDS